MTISFNCPHCDKVYKVADNFAGKAATCNKCRGRIDVPGVQQPALVEPMIAPQANLEYAEQPQLDEADAFSQIEAGTRGHSSVAMARRRAKPKYGLLIIGMGAIFILLLAVGGVYLLIPPSPSELLPGVWKFEKETGGMFSEENSQGDGAVYEFFEGGKVQTESEMYILIGRWEIDDSTNPPTLNLIKFGDDIQKFGVEFPSRDVMLLTRSATETTFRAEGTTTKKNVILTFHYRRLTSGQ